DFSILDSFGTYHRSAARVLDALLASVRKTVSARDIAVAAAASVENPLNRTQNLADLVDKDLARRNLGIKTSLSFYAGVAVDGRSEDLRVQRYGSALIIEPGTITEVIGSCAVAPTGASIQVDILKNRTTIFTTKPTIPARQKTMIPGTLKSNATVAKGDVLQFKLTHVGSTIKGQDLHVALLVRKA
ncbi:MAG: hypothetical protein AAF442_01850, partial [Pseudomonadota bacterium]